MIEWGGGVIEGRGGKGGEGRGWFWREGMGKRGGGMGNGSVYKMILSLGRGAKEKIEESETQRFA